MATTLHSSSSWLTRTIAAAHEKPPSGATQRGSTKTSDVLLRVVAAQIPDDQFVNSTDPQKDLNQDEPHHTSVADAFALCVYEYFGIKTPTVDLIVVSPKDRAIALTDLFVTTKPISGLQPFTKSLLEQYKHFRGYPFTVRINQKSAKEAPLRDLGLLLAASRVCGDLLTFDEGSLGYFFDEGAGECRMGKISGVQIARPGDPMGMTLADLNSVDRSNYFSAMSKLMENIRGPSGLREMLQTWVSGVDWQGLGHDVTLSIRQLMLDDVERYLGHLEDRWKAAKRDDIDTHSLSGSRTGQTVTLSSASDRTISEDVGRFIPADRISDVQMSTGAEIGPDAPSGGSGLEMAFAKETVADQNMIAEASKAGIEAMMKLPQRVLGRLWRGHNIDEGLTHRVFCEKMGIEEKSFKLWLNDRRGSPVAARAVSIWLIAGLCRIAGAPLPESAYASVATMRGITVEALIASLSKAASEPPSTGPAVKAPASAPPSAAAPSAPPAATTASGGNVLPLEGAVPSPQDLLDELKRMMHLSALDYSLRGAGFVKRAITILVLHYVVFVDFDNISDTLAENLATKTPTDKLMMLFYMNHGQYDRFRRLVARSIFKVPIYPVLSLTNNSGAADVTLALDAMNYDSMVHRDAFFIFVSRDGFAAELLARCKRDGRNCRLVRDVIDLPNAFPQLKATPGGAPGAPLLAATGAAAAPAPAAASSSTGHGDYGYCRECSNTREGVEVLMARVTCKNCGRLNVSYNDSKSALRSVAVSGVCLHGCFDGSPVQLVVEARCMAYEHSAVFLPLVQENKNNVPCFSCKRIHRVVLRLGCGCTVGVSHRDDPTLCWQSFLLECVASSALMRTKNGRFSIQCYEPTHKATTLETDAYFRIANQATYNKCVKAASQTEGSIAPSVPSGPTKTMSMDNSSVATATTTGLAAAWLAGGAREFVPTTSVGATPESTPYMDKNALAALERVNKLDPALVGAAQGPVTVMPVGHDPVGVKDPSGFPDGSRGTAKPAPIYMPISKPDKLPLSFEPATSTVPERPTTPTMDRSTARTVTTTERRGRGQSVRPEKNAPVEEVEDALAELSAPWIARVDEKEYRGVKARDALGRTIITYNGRRVVVVDYGMDAYMTGQEAGSAPEQAFERFLFAKRYYSVQSQYVERLVGLSNPRNYLLVDYTAPESDGLPEKLNLSDQQLVSAARQLARALRDLHAAGVVHGRFHRYSVLRIEEHYSIGNILPPWRFPAPFREGTKADQPKNWSDYGYNFKSDVFDYAVTILRMFDDVPLSEGLYIRAFKHLGRFPGVTDVLNRCINSVEHQPNAEEIYQACVTA